MGAEKAIVGISGEALRRLQEGRRYLSPEEKIDIAGLNLKKRIEAGVVLTAVNLQLRGPELESVVRELGLRL